MANLSMKKVRVLLTGLDAKSAAPYVNIPADELQKLLEASIAHMKQDTTIDFEICWLTLADSQPAHALAKHLQQTPESFDGVMIGWGVRGVPPLSWLLEDCCEAVKDNAPKTTKFLFSTTPSDHHETVYRKFPHAKPGSK